MENIRLSLFGKMSPAHSVPQEERTSEPSSKRSSASKTKPPMFLDLRAASGTPQERSWVTGIPLHGASSMLNFGEFPNAAEESFLCQILQANVPDEFSLSATACSGILRRAENRGKELPNLLRFALLLKADSYVGVDGYNAALTGEQSSTLGVNCGISTGRNGVMCIRERCGCEGGGKGCLVQENVAGSIACRNDWFLCYAVGDGQCVALDRAAYNQGRNAQFDMGIDESGKAYTVVAKGLGAVCYVVDMGGGKTATGVSENITPTLACTHGGEPAVCYSINTMVATRGGADDGRTTFGVGENGEAQFTISAAHPHAVCYAVDCRNGKLQEVNGTLQAKPNGGTSFNLNNVVLIPAKIILRRLTPTECARLQGMPDWWVDGIENPNPTEDDMRFWREVFETHRRIVTGASKPKTDKQIRKWLANPHSDSAEYKMWGNGVALPCVMYVMEGIAREMEETK